MLPGTGMFIPAGSAAGKDKGLFRLKAPEFLPDLCTGCMECALACPDAAIPNTVHDINDLLLTAVRQLDIAEAQREALRNLVHPLADAAREVYRRDKSPKPFHEIVAAAAEGLSVDSAVLRGNLRKLSQRARRVPGRQDPAVLRRRRKRDAGFGRPVLRGDRSVEVHRLPRMRRRLRPARARRAPAGP